MDPLGLSPNLGWAQGYVVHPGCMVDLLGLMAHGAAERRAMEVANLDNLAKNRQVIGSEIPLGHQLNPHHLEISRSSHPETAVTFDRAMEQGQPDLLQRVGPATRDHNRSLATRGWNRSNGSPDEFPYASTSQGGDSATVVGVSRSAQNAQGGMLKNFYQSQGVKVGDWFHVSIKD